MNLKNFGVIFMGLGIGFLLVEILLRIIGISYPAFYQPNPHTGFFLRPGIEGKSPGGIICQWMPMYRISKNSFDVAFRTFSEVFENLSFWYVRGHGLFVAPWMNFK